MKHKLGSKVWFYKFGYNGDKVFGVVSSITENVDGSYTVEVNDQWILSADLLSFVKD